VVGIVSQRIARLGGEDDEGEDEGSGLEKRQWVHGVRVVGEGEGETCEGEVRA
jgi:hypothetical protein